MNSHEVDYSELDLPELTGELNFSGDLYPLFIDEDRWEEGYDYDREDALR